MSWILWNPDWGSLSSHMWLASEETTPGRGPTYKTLTHVAGVGGDHPPKGAYKALGMQMTSNGSDPN
ncbi:hypothetical protein NL676_010498 [Syzygium grande]|nr:hypothetical protein NL676_010498 [Syzygium grande]